MHHSFQRHFKDGARKDFKRMLHLHKRNVKEDTPLEGNLKEVAPLTKQNLKGSCKEEKSFKEDAPPPLSDV